MRLDNISTADLRAELDQIVSDTAEWVERASIILVELRKRKESHPLMHSNILRFFHGIASGALSASAVISVGGNRNIVRAFKGLPREKQDSIARGAEVPVVDRKATGEIFVENRPIMTLAPATLERVFSDQGVRSIEEQTKLVEKAPERVRVNGFYVDKSNAVISIGNRRIKPFDLIGPLKALGYRLEKISEESEA